MRAGSGTRPHQGLSRLALALLFIIAGVLHFLFPATYLQIMPPYFDARWHLHLGSRLVSLPLLLIWISGAAEIAGGLGLLVPATRNVARWGLAALLVAVFPANLYIAHAHLRLPGIAGQGWAQWARLPMQAVLIWWVLSCRRD